MKYIRRISGFVLASFLCIFSTIAVQAEGNQDQLNTMQQQLQQNNDNIQQKQQEQQAIQQEINNIQQDLNKLNDTISQNEAALKQTQQKIQETNKQIEQKKEEIIKLEDKVLARQGVMKERMVAIQDNDSTNLVVSMIVNSQNIGDFFDRMNAVATILGADKDILKMQQNDLQQIEKDKEAIKQKELALEGEKEKLAKSQAELEANIKKKQEALQTVQAKYNQIASQISQATQENTALQSSMKEVQATIARQQAAAQASKNEQASFTVPNEKAPAGKEFYVTATAYSAEGSPSHEWITSGGYNIHENPSMKLIAVDRSVIPLGKHVWVEGYGEAIAGDTGGDIVGYRIDVLQPSKAAESVWGVRRVKVVVLD
ncbi:3D domain-containing protein [Microbacteriaceae bacterium 4G12]